MTIPKKLKLGAFDWTVQESQDVAREGCVYGSTHFRTQKIFIDPDITEDNKAETFLHELLHTAVYHSGLTERLKTGTPSEEEILSSISPALYQAIHDNGLVF
jgi:hypothetical protein